MGYGQHVGGGGLRVHRDDRSDQQAAAGPGEVDADRARPVGLGDVLAVPGITLRGTQQQERARQRSAQGATEEGGPDNP